MLEMGAKHLKVLPIHESRYCGMCLATPGSPMSDFPTVEPSKDDARVATERLKQLIAIGIALTSERELSKLLERIVGEARQFANAETGALFLRDGDVLRFAVAQNDGRLERPGDREMRRHFAAEPLSLTQPSLAGYVALTGRLVNLPRANEAAPAQTYAFNRELDAQFRYQTGSVLVVPLQEPRGEVIGVLQLVNARNAAGEVVPFEAELEGLVQALASQAAVAIRNARLE